MNESFCYSEPLERSIEQNIKCLLCARRITCLQNPVKCLKEGVILKILNGEDGRGLIFKFLGNLH